jgi:hypothetical protein
VLTAMQSGGGQPKKSSGHRVERVRVRVGQGRVRVREEGEGDGVGVGDLDDVVVIGVDERVIGLEGVIVAEGRLADARQLDNAVSVTVFVAPQPWGHAVSQGRNWRVVRVCVHVGFGPGIVVVLGGWGC